MFHQIPPIPSIPVHSLPLLDTYIPRSRQMPVPNTYPVLRCHIPRLDTSSMQIPKEENPTPLHPRTLLDKLAIPNVAK